MKQQQHQQQQQQQQQLQLQQQQLQQIQQQLQQIVKQQQKLQQQQRQTQHQVDNITANSKISTKDQQELEEILEHNVIGIKKFGNFISKITSGTIFANT